MITKFLWEGILVGSLFVLTSTSVSSITTAQPIQGMMADKGSASAVACPAMAAGQERSAAVGLDDVIADKSELPSVAEYFVQKAVWAADSRSVYVVIMQRQSGISEQRTILRIDTRTGSCSGVVRGYDPLPSPDGKRLAFLSKIGGFDQLWIASSDGSNPAPVTSAASGTLASDFSKEIAWSSDSKQLAFVVSHRIGLLGLVLGAQATPAPVPVVLTPKSIDQAANVESELWVDQMPNGSLRRLASFPFEAQYICWDERHGRIVFASHKASGNSDDYAIKALRLTDGRTTTLFRPGGMQQTLLPLPSPDGQKIAFAFDPSNTFYDWKASLFVGDPNIHRIDRLTDGRTAPSFDRVWAPDSARIYTELLIGSYKQIFSVDLHGHLLQITHEPTSDEGVQVSPNGKQLLWWTQDAIGQSDVRIARLDGTGEHVIYVLHSQLNRFVLEKPEEITWAGDDGVRLYGLLFLPRRFNPRKHYPMYVEFHGAGREALVGEISFDPLEWQMWLDRGFIVFVPDYAGFGSYGSDVVMKRIKAHRLYDSDINDVASGIKKVEARGYVDRRNIFLMAESAGASHANLWITRSNPFRAVVSYEGWGDWYNFMYSRVTPLNGHFNSVDGELQGAPWNVPQYWMKRSAIYHLKGMKTPTMWLAGDTNYGAAGAEASGIRLMYAALAAQTGDAELVEYPKEGHGMIRIEDIRDALKRVLHWVDSHRIHN